MSRFLALIGGAVFGAGLVLVWELGRQREHRAMIDRMDTWSGV